jgi:hypothetical protein
MSSSSKDVALPQPAQQQSIYKETLALLRPCLKYLLLFVPFIILLQVSLPSGAGAPETSPLRAMCMKQADPKACIKEHLVEILNERRAEREANKSIVVNVLGRVLVTLLLFSVIAYLFSTLALQRVTEKKLGFSLEAYGLYLGRVLLKYVRPLLWLALPIVGWFMYARSILRSTLVAPLSLLDDEAVFKSSWRLTENNAWRLFGVSIAVSLTVMGVLLPASVFVSFFMNLGGAADGDAAGRLLRGSPFASLNFLYMPFAQLIDLLYTIAAYRVLVREKGSLAPDACSAAASGAGETSDSF